ncbi:hypothetical protein BDQ12DRAFT_670609 [Crucibulum laeve]|uniref:NAD(P)-binding protein n=1 Tax=Crucibulum laeve TaxID=68775 RepID=A0A5C3LIX8_9AGAR|nr:hypothetical protein BDQ12DRAFT_670609 [Crucibulum laeve]
MSTPKVWLSGLSVIKLDVTKQSEISDVFAQAKNAFNGTDVVFNNAGTVSVREIEGTPDNVACGMFEILFWRAANVTRDSVKYFRENSPAGGNFLQMSSNFGLERTPGAGIKALEGLTHALSKEIHPKWNIKTTFIELGPFRTGMVDGDDPESFVLPPHPARTDNSLPTLQFRKWMKNATIDGDTKKATQAFYKLTALSEPPFRLPIHKDAIHYTRRKAQCLIADTDRYEF